MWVQSLSTFYWNSEIMATLGKVLQRHFHKIKLIRFNRIISETTDSIFDM